jgi:dienelactone hydrolase
MTNQSRSVSFVSCGLTLTGFLTHPDRGVNFPSVLFIHGGGKYSENLYKSWQEYLSNNGFASLSFYCRGVGSSMGEFSDGGLMNRLSDAMAAYDFLRESGISDPKRICIYGSSMGAHVAVRLVEKYPDIKAIILQSAAAYSLRAEKLSLNEEFTAEIRNNQRFDESPVFSILERFKGVAFVVYGEDDSLIPKPVKELFRGSINIGSFTIIKGGTHKLLRPSNDVEMNARNELYRKGVDFLKLNL